MRRDELIAAIYKARWVDGIRNGALVSDSAIADAILESNKSTETKEG